MKKPTKLQFKDNFKRILRELGIPKVDRDKFFEEGCRLRDIRICIRITDIIDEKLKYIYPQYDGCISTDTFDKIYDFNFLRDIC